jgi:hypothetical protein
MHATGLINYLFKHKVLHNTENTLRSVVSQANIYMYIDVGDSVQEPCIVSNTAGGIAGAMTPVSKCSAVEASPFLEEFYSCLSRSSCQQKHAELKHRVRCDSYQTTRRLDLFAMINCHVCLMCVGSALTN